MIIESIGFTLFVFSFLAAVISLIILIVSMFIGDMVNDRDDFFCVKMTVLVFILSVCIVLATYVHVYEPITKLQECEKGLPRSERCVIIAVPESTLDEEEKDDAE